MSNMNSTTINQLSTNDDLQATAAAIFAMPDIRASERTARINGYAERQRIGKRDAKKDIEGEIARLQLEAEHAEKTVLAEGAGQNAPPPTNALEPTQPTQMSWADEVYRTAKAIFDKPDMLQGERDELYEALAKRHGKGKRIATNDVSAVGKKLLDEAAAESTAAGGPVCEEALGISLKWGPCKPFERADQIPRSLDEMSWPLDSSLVSYALDILDRQFCVAVFGSKTRYVSLDDIDSGEGVEAFYISDFVAKFENRVTYRENNEGKVTFVPLTKLWLEHPERQQYDRVTFCPHCEEAPNRLNLFTGYAVKPKEGDWSLLRAHILDNLCKGNKQHFRWLMAWMAQLLQDPDQKLGTAVVFKGKKGTGKTKLSYWLRKIIGKAHSKSVTQAVHVTGKFNGHLALCVLLVCEEAFFAGDKQAAGTVKGLITDDTIMLEKKSIDAVEVQSFVRLMIIGNEKWMVHATEDERRFFVLEVGDAQQQNPAYFKAIDDQMENGGAEAMMHDLLQHQYAADDGSGVVDLRNPPKTEGLKNQVAETLPAVDKWIRNILIDGGLYTHGVPNPNAEQIGPPFKELGADASTRLAKEVVRMSAAKACPSQYSEANDTGALTEKLKERFPTLGTSQKTHGDRRPAYEFPPLTAMREAWTAQFGERPWDDQGTEPAQAIDLVNIAYNAFWALRAEAENEAAREAGKIDARTPSERTKASAAIEYSAADYLARVADAAAVTAEKKSEVAAKAAAKAADKRAVAIDAAGRAELAKVRLAELEPMGSG